MIQPYTYLIKFNKTGQVYYGSRSKNIKLGLAPENDLMVKYFTSCQPLKRLIKKHGLTAFSWQVRRRFDTPQQATKWEQKVLRRMKVLHNPKWFNQNIAGYIVPTAAGLKKISETHKGILKSEEHKLRISEALKGKKKSANHCANISKSLTGNLVGEKAAFFGHHHTEETKRTHSEFMKGRIPPNKGIAMTQEQKDKISATKKAKILTEEDREKRRKAQRAAVEARLKKREETREKIRQEIQAKQKPNNLVGLLIYYFRFQL